MKLALPNPQYVRALAPGERAPAGRAFVAFAGRSNSGKSSVINALCGGRFARVSGVPGSTQAIQLFAAGEVWVADMPGYGYAARAKGQRQKWQNNAARFVNSARLLAVVTVVDCRRGIGELDADWLRLCLPVAGASLLLLNKSDKLNRQQQQAALTRARAAPVGEARLFSALKKSGVEEARDFLTSCVLPAAQQGGA